MLDERVIGPANLIISVVGEGVGKVTARSKHPAIAGVLVVALAPAALDVPTENLQIALLIGIAAAVEERHRRRCRIGVRRLSKRIASDETGDQVYGLTNLRANSGG